MPLEDSPYSRFEFAEHRVRRYYFSQSVAVSLPRFLLDRKGTGSAKECSWVRMLEMAQG